MSGPPDRIYVFRVGQLGDTVVALPALFEIAKRYPQGGYTLITNAPARSSYVTAWDVLRHTGLFRDVIYYDASSASSVIRLAMRIRTDRGRRLLFYLTPPRAQRQIIRDRYFYELACGFEQIIGLDGSGMPDPRGSGGKLRYLPRESDRLLELVATSLGTDGRCPVGPLLNVPPETETKVKEMLASMDGRRLVAFSPGSKMPAKKWFLERFIEVARRILSRSDQHGIVVVGGPEDRKDGEALVQSLHTDRALNLAGHTNIIESAAVLRRCDFYLGNDTGTMHIAGVMGTHCVAIFTSRTNPGWWDPWGEGHAILRRDLPCSGCMLTDCVTERMRCLDLITVDDVWLEVERALESCRARS